MEMEYQGFKGTIEELVRQNMEEIERQEGVAVLFAVESGSRAWGFASPDSDYDVRFVYVRPRADYLKLEQKKDFMDWKLDEVLDINGWDLRKALRQVHKSNAAIFEWLHSPIVYWETGGWEKVRQAAGAYFSCKAAMCHYYGAAKNAYMGGLAGERVCYKKYLYALRPLLACQWIEEEACPPPVLFAELADAVLGREMRQAVDGLLRAKAQMAEAEDGQRIGRLDAYLAEKLEEFKVKSAELADDRRKGWQALDEVFGMLLC